MLSLLLLLSNFNPHSRKGSDLWDSSSAGCCCNFNPHSRKGSDGGQKSEINDCWDFNPHSRKGSDFSAMQLVLLTGISIHTPARGVTSKDDIYGWCITISIHTPARGVTFARSNHRPGEGISIHTPARGVTTPPKLLKSVLSHFNPHSRKGSDMCLCVKDLQAEYFNPHSRKGSDRELFEYFFVPDISIHTPARGVTEVCPFGYRSI